MDELLLPLKRDKYVDVTEEFEASSLAGMCRDSQLSSL